MNESLIFGIIIGALVVAIFLFFTKRKSGIIDNTVLFEKEKEIGVLREEKNSKRRERVKRG